MKLRPLNPMHRYSVAMVSIARRLSIPDLVSSIPRASNSLIIVTNGDSEDRVLIVLAKTLDGKHMVDVVFPEFKGLAIFDVIGEYVDRGYNRIVVMIDQEKHSLKDIIEYIKERVSHQGSINCFDIMDREAFIEISRATRRSWIGVIINGIDDERFTRHTIEDHLLIAAEKCNLISLAKSSKSVDPKAMWKSLNKDQQLEVLRTLTSNHDLTRTIFRQQIAVLERLTK